MSDTVRAIEIQALTDVHDHLNFIKELIHRDQFDITLRRSLEEDIEHIQQRSADPNLYLAIVGQMSTGKTTLINALLRDELLKAHALVMTTAASTIIKPGRELTVTVRLNSQQSVPLELVTNGQGQSVTANGNLPDDDIFIDVTQQRSMEHICVTLDDEPITVGWMPHQQPLTVHQFIEHVTTADEIAEQISSVTITHNAPFLTEGIFLVDTPGLDATNLEHAEVTRQAVAQADTAVIIIPADKPVSQRLGEFLNDEEFLQPYLHRCIFLVTRMDMIPANQQNRLMQTIERRLIQQLHLSEPPIIYSCSAQSVIDALTSSPLVRDVDERVYWQQQFAELETRLLAQLKKERNLSIAEHILRLLHQVIQLIQAPLQAQWESYNRHADAIEQARIQDLGAFANEQHEQCRQQMQEVTEQAISDATLLITAQRNYVIESIQARIFGVSDINELKEFAEKGAEAVLKDAWEALQTQLEQCTTAMLNGAAEVSQTFDERFRAAYARLAVLQHALDQQIDISDSMSSHTPDVLKTLAVDTGLTGTGKVLATGAGALVGAMVLGSVVPVVGHAAGLWLGSKVGKLFGPSIDQRKQTLWATYNSNLVDHFTTVEQQVLDVLQQHGSTLETSLHERIDHHADTYQRQVDRMISEQQAEHDHVMQAQRIVAADLQELERREEIVRTRRERLHAMRF